MRTPPPPNRHTPEAWWTLAPAAVLESLRSSATGLSSTEAAERFAAYGPNSLEHHRRHGWWSVLLQQLRNPLLLILAVATVVSVMSGEVLDATIVAIIVLASVGIGTVREHAAQDAAAALQAQLKTTAVVLRDGHEQPIPVDALVLGDVVLLSAGKLVPADCALLSCEALFVSEAVLTGESFATEKHIGPVDKDSPLTARSGSVFLGSNVRSGSGVAVVVDTARFSHFGAIAKKLTLRAPPTEFERGIKNFGYLLTISMLVLVLLVLVAHMARGRPALDTLLFAVALAVGLSPELLPAILSVNLARGATRMQQRGVLVRRLNAIENLGSMNILCTDKTGTLTEGVVAVDGSFDALGVPDSSVLRLAQTNAAAQRGLDNPLDEALLHTRDAAAERDDQALVTCAELPFNFIHKRLSVIVKLPSATDACMITKGAFAHVLDVCASLADGTPIDDAGRASLQLRHTQWSENGVRVIAVASKTVSATANIRDEEHDLVFLGFVTFLDRPKAGVAAALSSLAKLGVEVKLITGDNQLVARHIARSVGLDATRVLTGADLDNLHDESLWHSAEITNIFAEVDPNQKERIIQSLQKKGHVVGFLGDGVNDAPAMHAADTSLSVKDAVDVAKEAADFVLLQPDLDVIRAGIEEGRRTFANTMKYILTTTSANVGNMLSMACASLFLPFLPLTAGQILLNNLLSDIPAIGIANDAVDEEMIATPRRFHIRRIARFMMEFGLLSSCFDLMTFLVLLYGFNANQNLFRTGWFVESLLSELAIALVVRTRRHLFLSRPGRFLWWSTLVLAVVALALPLLPLARPLGFVTMPVPMYGAVLAIVALYVVAAEFTKRWFYQRANNMDV